MYPVHNELLSMILASDVQKKRRRVLLVDALLIEWYSKQRGSSMHPLLINNRWRCQTCAIFIKEHCFGDKVNISGAVIACRRNTECILISSSFSIRSMCISDWRSNLSRSFFFLSQLLFVCALIQNLQYSK
jgi:hypothetical protein